MFPLGQTMKRNSLLDYLADSDTPEPQSTHRQRSEFLLERLQQLEGKLAALSQAENTAAVDHGFSGQIETILRRQPEQLRSVAQPLPPAPVARSRQPARTEIPPPPLAWDPPASLPGNALELTKFLEAVRLIGHAANRFLPEPPRAPQPREPAPVSEDTIRLTAALKETVAAFQAMTTELSAAAGEIRRSAEPVPVRIEDERARDASRLSHEDAELFRLQDELDGLRERLDAMARRKGRGGY
jgi:hypothetical protein